MSTNDSSHGGGRLNNTSCVCQSSQFSTTTFGPAGKPTLRRLTPGRRGAQTQQNANDAYKKVFPKKILLHNRALTSVPPIMTAGTQFRQINIRCHSLNHWLWAVRLNKGRRRYIRGPARRWYIRCVSPFWREPNNLGNKCLIADAVTWYTPRDSNPEPTD